MHKLPLTLTRDGEWRGRERSVEWIRYSQFLLSSSSSLSSSHCKVKAAPFPFSQSRSTKAKAISFSKRSAPKPRDTRTYRAAGVTKLSKKSPHCCKFVVVANKNEFVFGFKFSANVSLLLFIFWSLVICDQKILFFFFFCWYFVKRTSKWSNFRENYRTFQPVFSSR